MQPNTGAFPDGEWDFSRIFSTEELEFTPDFLAHFSFPLESHEGSQFATVSDFSSSMEEDINMAGADHESLFYSLNNLNPDSHFISQENSNNSRNGSSSVFIPSTSHETYFFSDSNNHISAANDNTMSMDICMMDDKNGGSFSIPLFSEIAMIAPAPCINEDVNSEKKINLNEGQPETNASSAKELQPKRKIDAPEFNSNNPSDIMKKKPRVTKNNAQKGKKNLRSKRNQKLTPRGNDEEECNAGLDGQSSRSYSSEDENASQDSNGGATSDSKVSEALNSNGKTRASRGSATDPQSLYARKRRERINERLRILQNLVPNGTKVDISTMLEEAVNYVKFLQLQIKLLSSDDLWMYAPIAYNGMDVGLNQKISTLL